MRLLFRTDASREIGTGHVMRCLALADALRAGGADVFFICRELPGHMESAIRQQGFEALMLPAPQGKFRLNPEGPTHSSWLGVSQREDAEQTHEVVRQLGALDWIVVDHYALDARWESDLREVVRHIAVIDDLADRQHDCDVLLDQTYGREPVDYDGLVPASVRYLLGPRYALLRKEFALWRPRALARRQLRAAPRRLFVNFGGVDACNATGFVLRLLDHVAEELPSELAITVVVGATSPYRREVEASADRLKLPTTVLSGVMNMAELMTEADLAIGAAGATSWERCCLGLPALIIEVAKNQRLIAKELDRAGAAIFSGTQAEVEQEPERLLRALYALLADGQATAQISESAAAISDGHGADRVALALLSSGANGNTMTASRQGRDSS